MDGSTAQTVPIGSSTPVATIYRPKAWATTANTVNPAFAGFTPTFDTATSSPTYRQETDGLNNVVKLSKSGAAFYSGSNYTAAGVKRAAAIPTSTPSLNGRSINLARWNKPLLMMPLTQSSATAAQPYPWPVSPSQGATKFPTPDWILVARNGTNPGGSTPGGTLPSTFGTAGINDITSSNPNFVTGRFAYTIYNEGGLLDANVAGYPSVVTSTAVPLTSPAIADQTIYKNSATYADLTQLADLSTTPQLVWSGSDGQKLVDQLVGWRNKISAAASGAPGTYTFASATNTSLGFFNWTTLNFGNFLAATNVSPVSNGVPTVGSDRIFATQQLIQFVTHNLGGNAPLSDLQQRILQSLGTFGRALNQPSIWPDPTRPKVLRKPSLYNDPVNNVDPTPADTASGGNTAYSADGSLTDVFNPVFKSVRVASPFARFDGSQAVLGEPLVKKRFALSRVAWITYKGPSADLYRSNQGDPLIVQMTNNGVPIDLIREGTRDNIKNYFGLTWYAGKGDGGIGGFWYYDHGINASNAPIIGSLYDPQSTASPRDVVSAGREPDFFELLKATINAGAIAKNWSGIGSNGYQSSQDCSVSTQIFAIGANIIDRASFTQFPTTIRYYYQSGDLREVYGKTDLPYYNGDCTFAVITNNPTVQPSTQGLPIKSTLPIADTNAAGSGAVLMCPRIWDPYDVNGPTVTNSQLAPSRLRIVVTNPLNYFNLDTNLSHWPPTSPWVMGGNAWHFNAVSTFTRAKLPRDGPSRLRGPPNCLTATDNPSRAITGTTPEAPTGSRRIRPRWNSATNPRFIVSRRCFSGLSTRRQFRTIPTRTATSAWGEERTTRSC